MLVLPSPRKFRFLWIRTFDFARLPANVPYSRGDRVFPQGMSSLRNRKGEAQQLERRGGFRWREVDVETDDLLRRQFTDEVPVVFIDGRKAFKYRLDEQEFLKKLAG